MRKFYLVASVLPCAAAALVTQFSVARPATATSLNSLVMSGMDDPHFRFQHDAALDSVKLDEATVAKAAAAAADSEVEVLREHKADPSQLTVREATDVRIDHYRGTYEAASFFDALLKERQASGEAEGESNPIDTTIKEKVRKMSFLQSELEYVVSTGLASDARRKWLVDKAALEEQKRECKQQWVRVPGHHSRATKPPLHPQLVASICDLSCVCMCRTPLPGSLSSQADLQDRQQGLHGAFDQLSRRSGQDGSNPAAHSSSALALASEWSTSTILSKASLKEQVALIEEHVALSKRQMALDAEDEALMQVALLLYQDEWPSRDRRAEILENQQKLLTELRLLVEDTSAFNGHSAFVQDGFGEGLTY